MLHKLAISNWLPTSNTTTLTLDQSKLLYRIGKSMAFDLGYKIFQILHRAPFKQSSTSILPFPNLIYAMLLDQGLIRRSSAVITFDNAPFVITPNLLTIDKFQYLPYNGADVAHKEASHHSIEPAMESADDGDPRLNNISSHAVNNEIFRANELLRQVDFVSGSLLALKQTLRSFTSSSSKGE